MDHQATSLPTCPARTTKINEDLRYQTVRMKRISLRSAILLLLVVKATLCASTSQPAVDWCWQSVYASQDNETLGPSHCPRVMRHLTCNAYTASGDYVASLSSTSTTTIEGPADIELECELGTGRKRHHHDVYLASKGAGPMLLGCLQITNGSPRVKMLIRAETEEVLAFMKCKRGSWLPILLFNRSTVPELTTIVTSTPAPTETPITADSNDTNSSTDVSSSSETPATESKSHIPVTNISSSARNNAVNGEGEGKTPVLGTRSSASHARCAETSYLMIMLCVVFAYGPSVM